MKGLVLLLCAVTLTQADRPQLSLSGRVCDCNSGEVKAACAQYGSDSKLFEHENCNQFYKCSNGQAYPYFCSSGLVYDPLAQICDFPSNVNCGSRPIVDESEIDCSKEVEDDSDSSSSDGSGSGSNPDNVTCNCNPDEAPGICAAPGSDGILIAHEKCNKLYKCANGVPVALKCPGNLLYNAYTQQCDWANTVECGDRFIVDEIDNGGSDNGADGNGDGDNGNTCNCNPEEAPAICASENSDGVFVAHEKCNKFYKCASGIPVMIKCPGNLLYDPLNNVCDWPENVDCGERPIIEIDNGGDGDNDNGDNNNNSGNCDPSEAPAICATPGSDGVLVAHENCNQFYKCSDGLPVALICPSSLLYNPATEQCDWPQNVDCGDRTVSEDNDNEGNEGNGDNSGNGDNGDSGSNGDNGGNGNGDGESGSGSEGTCNCNPGEAPGICAAPGSDGILIAHEKCNKFYNCANGVPVALNCPGNLLYNPYTQQCDWPNTVECGDRIIVDEIDNGGSDNGGSDNGADGNGDGDNGNTCNCNPEEAPAICASENSDGVFVAHEKCNKFYKCASGIPVMIKCPGNLLYDPLNKICDWPENVDCGKRPIVEIDNGGDGDNDNGDDNNNSGNCDPSEAPAICAAPGSDGVLIAHENCNQFYKCSDGLPVALICPSSLLYNPATEQCDWPQNVDCGDRIVSEDNDNEGNEGNGDNSGNGDNGDSGSNGDNGGNGNGDGENGSEGTCNCNPGEAPGICAAPGSDGILIAHEKCNKFYNCANGIPVALNCPRNLLYNPYTQQCDWPNTVECGDRIIVDEIDNGGSDNGGSDNGADGNGDGDNGNTCNCNPEEAPAICASENSDGVFVAHEKCNKFYKCASGIPVMIKCPGNLLYDPLNKVCDWPENVDCGKRPIVEIDNGGDGDNDDGDDNNNSGNCDPSEAPAICAAPGSNGVLVAHENCNQFYKCSDGLPVALICPSSLLYNPATEQCDWPQNVDCGDRTVSEDNDNKGNEGNGDNSGNGDNGDSGSNGDNGGNGNGDGESGSEGTCNCNPGEAPGICAAPGSDGILIAHEKCNKFYNCANGVPVALNCPGNLLYNPYTQQCDWPNTVECGDRIIVDEIDNGGSDNGGSDNGADGNGDGDNGNTCNCNPEEAPAICASENSDGVFVAHEKCNKFYKCASGIPVMIKCPGNLLYDPLNKVCDWPENVDCGKRPIVEIDNGGDGDNDNGDDNNNSGNCDPSKAPAICAAPGSDGVLIAHENCNQFYKCSDGLPVALICPSSLLYNPATEQCDWPQNVDCGDRTVSEDNDNEGNEGNGDNSGNGDNGDSGSNGDNGGNGNGDGESGSEGTCNCNPGEAPGICAAPGSDGILIAHEKCNKFYNCANGVPVALNCPGNLLYNPYTQQCDWPNTVECGDRIIVDEIDNGGSDNGADGNGDGDNGNTCNCNPEEAPAICASENSDGVFVAHEKCNKFYKCASGIPVMIKCPGNLLYDPLNNVCDWPENVDCGERPIVEIDNGGDGDNDNGDDNNNSGNCDPSEAPAICATPGSDGVLVAHENCNQFYKCSDGLPVALICPSLLLYNPATEQCDWPQNVDCGDRLISGDQGSHESETWSLNKHMEARRQSV